MKSLKKYIVVAGLAAAMITGAAPRSEAALIEIAGATNGARVDGDDRDDPPFFLRVEYDETLTGALSENGRFTYNVNSIEWSLGDLSRTYHSGDQSGAELSFIFNDTDNTPEGVWDWDTMTISLTNLSETWLDYEIIGMDFALHGLQRDVIQGTGMSQATDFIQFDPIPNLFVGEIHLSSDYHHFSLFNETVTHTASAEVPEPAPIGLILLSLTLLGVWGVKRKVAQTA